MFLASILVRLVKDANHTCGLPRPSVVVHEQSKHRGFGMDSSRYYEVLQYPNRESRVPRNWLLQSHRSDLLAPCDLRFA